MTTRPDSDATASKSPGAAPVSRREFIAATPAPGLALAVTQAEVGAQPPRARLTRRRHRLAEYLSR